MKIKQVRSATIILEYAGKRFLIDPMLARKGAYPGFPGTPNSHLPNPSVELVVPIEQITSVDAVVVTHTHPDHWDSAAQFLLPKHLPVFVQNASDAEIVRSSGFADVRILDKEANFEGITLIKTAGQHGSDAAIAALGKVLGEVCGVVFQHASERTLYLAGDTVWNEYVRQNLEMYRPDVIILNSGDAQVIGLGSIIMGKQDVYEVHRAAPNATLVATHMEAVNHALLSRHELREFALERGMATRLLVPEDGDEWVL